MLAQKRFPPAAAPQEDSQYFKHPQKQHAS